MPGLANGACNNAGLISVVIPFFNEEENVLPVIEELSRVLQGIGVAYEIIAVDDGSTDDTWRRLAALCQSSPGLRPIRLRANFGQTRAFSVGLEASRGDWIITMDGDGQNDPNSIGTLLEKAAQGSDVVSGWRKNRKDSKLVRTIPSRVANWLLANITGLNLHDSGCSLKLYRASAIRAISLYSDRHRFIPFLLHMKGFRVTEVVVNHRARTRGKSKYGFSRAIKVLLDLFQLTLFARFKDAPRFYFFIAAVPFLIGTIVSFSLAFSQLAGFSGVQGSVTYFGSTFLLLYAAISLVSFGLLAEWMNHFEKNTSNENSSD